MPATIVVGVQWGDEGKGKIVDMLAQSSHVVVRYSGGNNAGHSIMNEYGDFVLHLIPAGIFNSETHCFIERGVVIHPPSLVDEMRSLEKRHVSLRKLKINPCAHMVMPWHLLEDKGNEADGTIGTTLRGIGPCYQDKAGRWRALRIGDLLNKESFLHMLQEAYIQKKAEIWGRFPQNGNEFPNFESIRDSYMDAREILLPYVADTTMLIHRYMDAGKQILMEGAQGTLLDVDYGTYPYVTSSNTTSMAAVMLTGISPKDIERVIGVTKAYVTRVGRGPFPTEMNEADHWHIQNIGREFGATTGRPRRCGWLDLPLLAYAARVNHLTEIALTKLDILGTLQVVATCMSYGSKRHMLGALDIQNLEQAQPFYTSNVGWGNLEGIRFRDQLPEQALKYVRRIEDYVKVPVRYISIGGRREETISL